MNLLPVVQAHGSSRSPRRSEAQDPRPNSDSG